MPNFVSIEYVLIKHVKEFVIFFTEHVSKYNELLDAAVYNNSIHNSINLCYIRVFLSQKR